MALHMTPGTSARLGNRSSDSHICSPTTTDLSFDSCQVCWRNMRWHNGRSRRSRNLQPENASKGSVTKKDEGAAHSIQARRSLLQQRPDTFAQTNSGILTFRLQSGGGPYIPVRRSHTRSSDWRPRLPAPYWFCRRLIIPIAADSPTEESPTVQPINTTKSTSTTRDSSKLGAMRL